MKKNIHISVVLTLLFSLLFNGPAVAAPVLDSQVSQSINQAASYLKAVQNQDGGFPAKAGDLSSPGTSCWVVMALAAAGQDLDRKTIAYLTQSDITLESTTDYARLLLALSAAGQGPLFKNTNLADKIVSLQQKDGQFGQPQLGEAGFINTHLWSILALNSAGYDISNRELAKNWLTARQNADGGFGWAEGVASDSDDTAIAIQTLIVLGDKAGTSPVLKKALDYLKSCQEEDGGFTSGNDWMSSGSNASSTAWILQALTAAGQNLSTEWVKGGNGPASYLVSLQGSTGFYNWKTGVTATPVSTTAQTIMALSHKPFPVNVDLGRSPSQPQSVPDQGGRFSDLKSNYWAYEPIISLVEAGILSGYPDHTFRPEKKVSRAEFARYLVCGLGVQDLKPETVRTFPDVLESHWAYPYITITADKGFVTGRPDGTFDPSGEIKGAELAVMLVKALPSEQAGLMPSGPFWYSGYVDYARQKGLLYPDFDPNQSADRAQCAYSVGQLRNMSND